MGYNIGSRLVDDFLARSTATAGRCADFRDVGDVLAKVAFKAFLNVAPTVVHPPAGHPHAGREFALVFDDNPLAECVELPDEALGEANEGGLWYSNVLCGVVRGSLEMVHRAGSLFGGPFDESGPQIQYQVTAHFVSDVLRGDETTEMRVRLIKILDEEVPQSDD
jgi:hypothetical protein